MNVPPEIIHIVKQWVEKAENDLLTAEHTLTLKEKCPFDTICFHAHQCAEKYLKALLTLHSAPFPKTHNLPQLLSIIPEEIDLGFQQSDLLLINRYSIDTRYPGDWEPITRDEAQDAVHTAKMIRGEVRAKLPDETLSS